MRVYIPTPDTCVNSEIGFCILEYYEPKPLPVSKYSSLFSHSIVYKNVTKTRNYSFKDAFAYPNP